MNGSTRFEFLPRRPAVVPAGWQPAVSPRRYLMVARHPGPCPAWEVAGRPGGTFTEIAPPGRSLPRFHPARRVRPSGSSQLLLSG